MRSPTREHDAHQQRRHRARDPAHARRVRQIRSGHAGAAVSRSVTRNRNASLAYPQSFAEIMAGPLCRRRAALSRCRSRSTKSSWAKPPRSRFAGSANERRCSKPRNCASRSRAGCSSTRSTARSAPENSSRCWAAMAPESRCCCARWRACARPPQARCASTAATSRRSRVGRSRMRLGFLPQDPDAAPQGSLRESVLLGRFAHLGFWEAAGAADAQRVTRALADVGLESLRGARARHPVGRRATPRRHCPPAGAGAVYLPARRAHQSPRPRAAARHPRQPAAPHARRRRGHRQPARAQSRVALRGPRLPAVRQR